MSRRMLSGVVLLAMMCASAGSLLEPADLGVGGAAPVIDEQIAIAAANAIR